MSEEIRAEHRVCEECGTRFCNVNGVSYSYEQLRIIDLTSDRREFRARLKWIYDGLMRNMIKPIMTFEEYIEAIDKELSKEQETCSTGKTNAPPNS